MICQRKIKVHFCVCCFSVVHFSIFLMLFFDLPNTSKKHFATFRILNSILLPCAVSMVFCHSKLFEINQTWKFLEEIYNLVAFNNKRLDYNIYEFVSRPLFIHSFQMSCIKHKNYKCFHYHSMLTLLKYSS